MRGQSNLTLYEIFFELEIGISDRFPSLNPFTIRRTRSSEVFILVERLSNYNSYQGKKSKSKNRRLAGDNWF